MAIFDNLNFSEIIILVGGWVSSIVTYFVGKRQSDIQTDSAEIDNLKNIIKTQQEQIAWQVDRIKELQEQITELRNEIKALRGFEK